MLLQARVHALYGGACVCLLIALASGFVAAQVGGPQVLYAIAMGLALRFLNDSPVVALGASYCARQILRLGVMLLGARVTLDSLTAVGIGVGAGIALAVAATVALGMIVSRLLGRPIEQGLVSGCAVGVCGASAAAAISALLPPTRENDNLTLATIVVVTLLSTVAMVAYPWVMIKLGFTAQEAGVFLGGSIHDVAQVVVAGTLHSPEARDTATLVKMFRVALLVPIAATAAALLARWGICAPGRRVAAVPPFLLGFAALVAAGSLGFISPAQRETLGESSRWCLVVALGATAMQFRWTDVRRLGWLPVVLLVVETGFLAACVFALLLLRS